MLLRTPLLIGGLLFGLAACDGETLIGDVDFQAPQDEAVPAEPQAPQPQNPGSPIRERPSIELPERAPHAACGRTVVACDDVDAVLATGADLDRVRACTTLGSLFVPLEGPVSVDLPCLETIHGDLSIRRNTNTEELLLPSLREIGGNVAIDFASRLRTLDASSLSTVGGVFYVTGNRALGRLSIDLLESVGAAPRTLAQDYLYIARNPIACVADQRSFEPIVQGTVYVADNGSCI